MMIYEEPFFAAYFSKIVQGSFKLVLFNLEKNNPFLALSNQTILNI